MNSVILVGRLTDDPIVKENSDGTFRTLVTIAVNRDYKNQEGIYDTDFIHCVLWNGIASATKEYTRKGDIIGVRGKLQTYAYEVDNEKKTGMEVLVEKVTFMAHSAKKEIG